MDLNIINYILNKKKISQNELAEMLDPPVSKSILSKWKNGSEQIPPIRATELRRIARIGKYKDGQNEEWLKIIKNSKTSSDSWYESIFEQIKFQTQSIYLNGQYGEINYDSIWIENSQSMLITLNRAGVPVKDLHLTFEPTRPVIFDDAFEDDEYRTGTYVYTDDDKLLIPYIKAYCELRFWVMYNVTYINDKSISELQFDILQKIPEIALFHVDKELFKAVGTDMDVLNKVIENSRTETLQLMLQFSQNVPSKGTDYLNFLNANLDEIERDAVNSAEYQRQWGRKYSKQEEDYIDAMNPDHRILEGIKNNEKLLKEILEKLNNLTNK